MFDTITIGYGPAGISAALYLCRSNKKVLAIGKDFGSLRKAELIENYYGLAEPISGEALANIGQAQAIALGAEVKTAEVLDLSWEGHFIVTTNEGVYEAKTVLIATGSARKTLPIQGIAEFEGKGVSYCAVCDAFFYRNKEVAVIGSGDYALHEVQQLTPVASKVTLLTNGAAAPQTIPDGVAVDTRALSQVFGSETVEGVRFAQGEALAVSGIFLALGSASAADFARKIGAEIDNGKLVVDDQMQTALPGLFAAGDCIGGLMQVSTAVAEGAKASMSILKFLREQA